MELLTIILSSLLALVSPAGSILDRVAANTLRSQVESVEQLAVRIDNAPSYQLLQGKVQQIRIAARGVELLPDVRIEALELETEPVAVNLERLRGGKNPERDSLERPLQGAVRLVLTEADLNRALQSSSVKSPLQELLNRLVPQTRRSQTRTYELLNLSLELLENKRVRVRVQVRQSNLQPEETQPLDLTLELGLKMVAGRRLELIEPTGTLNGRQLSTRLLEGFAQGLPERLDLALLEEQGITSRILQLEIDDQAIHLAAFVRIEP